MAAKFIYICGVIARGVMDLRRKAKNDFGVYEKQAFWVSPRLHYHQVLVKATSFGFKSLHPHQVGPVVKTGPIFLYIVLLIRWWRRGDADEGKRTFQPISFDE